MSDFLARCFDAISCLQALSLSSNSIGRLPNHSRLSKSPLHLVLYRPFSPLDSDPPLSYSLAERATRLLPPSTHTAASELAQLPPVSSAGFALGGTTWRRENPNTFLQASRPSISLNSS